MESDKKMSRTIGSWRSMPFLLMGFLWLLSASCGRSNSQPIVATAPPSKTDLFTDTNIVRINIVIPRSGIKQLQRTSWNPGGGKDRPEVKATIVEGGAVYTNVAVHLKGAAGSFRPIDDRPAFTLNFDKFAKGQKFHGLQKLSLNNSVQDPTLVNEKICREMYEAAGVPVPRADYAVVSLNDRVLGVYVLVEGYNKQFLKRYFKDVTGNLYDGGFCEDLHDRMEVNSGDQPKDTSDVRRLMEAAERAREQNRLEELAKVLDIERFLSLTALEVIQCHWDGYSMQRNNYRLFNNRDTGQMIFMPHGLDQMFGIGDRPDVHTPIVPRMGGMIAAAVLGTKEGRARYVKRMGELRTNVFDPAKITSRARELQQRLRPVLAEFGPEEAAQHRSAVDWLCRNIVARAASIDEQLSEPNDDLAFGEDGTAKLAGWRPRLNGGHGSNGATKMNLDGRAALHLLADRDSSAASWRTRIALPRGRYRLEGLGKTQGLSRNGDGGALLRVSGSQNRQMLKGDADWSPLSFSFEVYEAMQEVELICELKGNRGEAWFDAGSLKVRRVN